MTGKNAAMHVDVFPWPRPTVADGSPRRISETGNRPAAGVTPGILVGCSRGGGAGRVAAAGLVQAPAVTGVAPLAPAAGTGGTQARRGPGQLRAPARSAGAAAAVH